MYQRVVVVGNLGRDPEMRYTANGTPVANFPVATNRVWNDGDGNRQEETTWFRVSVFGRQAEVCNQYLQKGRMVLVEGDIRTSTYTDQDGVERNGWELRGNVIKFLGGAGERGPQGADADFAVERGGVAAGAPPVNEDEIPF